MSKLLHILRPSLRAQNRAFPSVFLARNYTQPPTNPSNQHMDRAPVTPKPTASSTLTGGDHGSADVGPHRDIGPMGPTTPHTVNKDHGLDVQSDNSHKGMAEHAKAQKDPSESAKQAGGTGQKVSWDNEFPNKPKGPIIGMQDERGDVAGQRTGPGEGFKGPIAQVENDT